MLLGDDSDTEVTIKINKCYADRYDSWRQKEELQKLKDRYGDRPLKSIKDFGSNSSSSEDEDENAEQLTEQFEKDFFKTLSCLKKKDPRIYDKSTAFFNDFTPIQRQAKNRKKDDKPVFLRDYERKLIVEREGKLSEDEDENENTRPKSPTIAEEEKIIKENFKGALKDSDDDDDDKDNAWGGLFQKRHKTKEEEEKEEEDYREWLKGQKEEIGDKKTETDLKFLHDYWNDPNLSSNEKFLKDYILNKRFLEAVEDDEDDYIPTYEEVVHDSDENLSEDEKTLEKQEEFEHKFNFRFEEPDQEFIKRYPRTMENSLRKKDDRRKKKRQEVRERKEAQEAKKREELKRLKALKRKEIMEKIEKLKEITGNEEVGFKDEDIEDDFDPDEHDRRMRELFNSQFYEEEETTKPEFPELDEELEIENWNSWNGEHSEQHEYRPQEEHEPHCEDPDFNMDCDYDPASQFQNELIESTKQKKGRKWKSKFAQAVARKKPVFDSNSHTFEEYLDEYYKLDFEDLIGDLPCRFKYRKVLPNNFGLSVEEILQADDKELNKWCSLKRAVQHRPEHVEKYDVHAYRKKAMNEQLKKKIFYSIYEKPTENEVSTKQKKSKKRKHSSTEGDIELQADNLGNKKAKHQDNEETDVNYVKLAKVASTSADIHTDNMEQKKKKRKKHKENSVEEDGDLHCVISKKGREEENNISESSEVKESFKKKKKRKKSKADSTEENNGNNDINYKKGNDNENIAINSKNAEKSEKKIDGQIQQNSHNDQPSNMQGKRKKKKKKNKAGEESSNCNSHTGNNGAFNKHKTNQFSKKKNNKFHGKRSHIENDAPSISDARLRAYGINPKKYKNKLKYGNK